MCWQLCVCEETQVADCKLRCIAIICNNLFLFLEGKFVSVHGWRLLCLSNVYRTCLPAPNSWQWSAFSTLFAFFARKQCKAHLLHMVYTSKTNGNVETIDIPFSVANPSVTAAAMALHFRSDNNILRSVLQIWNSNCFSPINLPKLNFFDRHKVSSWVLEVNDHNFRTSNALRERQVKRGLVAMKTWLSGVFFVQKEGENQAIIHISSSTCMQPCRQVCVSHAHRLELWNPTSECMFSHLRIKQLFRDKIEKKVNDPADRLLAHAGKEWHFTTWRS